MGSARFFTLDSISHRGPNFDPPSPSKFNNDGTGEAVPIPYRISRCWKFICSSSILDLPEIPGKNEKHG